MGPGSQTGSDIQRPPPTPVNRMTDTHFWKHYLAPNLSFRVVNFTSSTDDCRDSKMVLYQLYSHDIKDRKNKVLWPTQISRWKHKHHCMQNILRERLKTDKTPHSSEHYPCQFAFSYLSLLLNDTNHLTRHSCKVLSVLVEFWLKYILRKMERNNFEIP